MAQTYDDLVIAIENNDKWYTIGVRISSEKLCDSALCDFTEVQQLKNVLNNQCWVWGMFLSQVVSTFTVINLEMSSVYRHHRVMRLTEEIIKNNNDEKQYIACGL